MAAPSEVTATGNLRKSVANAAAAVAAPGQHAEQAMTAAVQQLLADAQTKQSMIPPEMPAARTLLLEALRQLPRNRQVLDALGAFLCQNGDEEDADADAAGPSENAKIVLETSVRIDAALGRAGNPSKYMWLAQISAGRDALTWYERGLKATVEFYNSEEAAASEGVHPDLRLALGCARAAEIHCAVTELWMTDLCDEPEAQESCKQHLMEARRLAPIGGPH